jgi:hypothetical protein
MYRTFDLRHTLRDNMVGSEDALRTPTLEMTCLLRRAPSILYFCCKDRCLWSNTGHSPYPGLVGVCSLFHPAKLRTQLGFELTKMHWELCAKTRFVDDV